MTEEITLITEEGKETFQLLSGFEQSMAELAVFLEYVKQKYPNLSYNEAGWVSAYFLANLTGLIEANPYLEGLVKVTVDYVKSHDVDVVDKTEA